MSLEDELLKQRLARTGEIPVDGSVEQTRSLRAGRVLVDWLQNDVTRQTVAPYSLRGLPFPTIAAPVRWEELERAAAKARPESLVFTPADVRARIERDGDLFEPLR